MVYLRLISKFIYYYRISD